MAKIAAVSLSENKGEQKENVDSAVLKENFGLVDDAHAGDWHRQVSLLAQESIDKMNKQGLDVSAGDFAENLTTKDIDLLELDLGTRIRINGKAVLEITQHGKECHDRCAVYEQAGDCVMPREGIFAKVITSGEIKPGDEIEVLAND
ncbi:MOSC domain-containing protein [Sporohalobacter salinus]|uniref:MOSC domain-containing protein n=1 Tax=Sporohalobacter salinus TaxID=1494606 RepID=UPI001960C681|nr:MOSC domain-containing protein [Sporohalobacter salinus]MBM7624532.1 cyclic pyranopterin phosphate synthase [Sporohalobacter salinus]